jgi:hypothetical protein
MMARRNKKKKKSQRGTHSENLNVVFVFNSETESFCSLCVENTFSMEAESISSEQIFYSKDATNAT